MKRLKVILFVLILCFSLAFPAGAVGYTSYNYNSKGEAVKSPYPYTPVKEISGIDMGVGEFSNPSDIYRDYKGNIYICDSGNNRIVVLNSDFTFKKEITEITVGYFTEKLNNPSGVFVDPNTDLLYVADTDNGRVLALDENLTMVIRVDRPYQKGVVDEDFIFAPTKVAVDNGGRIFVVSKNTYEGLMQFDSKGEFLGFVGANKVSISPIEYFWKRLSTKAQASKLQLTLPTEFSNLEMDSDGFIYTTTSIISEDGAEILIRRQNPSGEDVLKTSEFLPIAGDIDYSTDTTSSAKYGPSSFVDVAIGDYGIYSALDAKRGRVFTYDFEGNLLYVFGGDGNNGNDLGCFFTPAAMIKSGENFAVLDMYKGTVTVFEPTEYGKLINEAVGCNYNGDYDASAKIWQKVIKLNCNYEQAYTGIGISQLRSGEYKQAMKSFKLGANKYYYSKAFKEYRQDWLEANFIWVAAIVVVALVLLCFGIVYSEKRRTMNKHTVLNSSIKYVFYSVAHPFDGFFEMKRRKMGSLKISSIILVAVILCFVIMRQLTGFIVNDYDLSEFNILNEVVKVIGPFALFCVINWCVTTLMDGEGKLAEIINCVATCLIPLTVSIVPLTVLSNVITQEEKAFYYVIFAIVIFYSLCLLLVGIMETHQYSFGKTIVSIIITIIGMVISIFILLLFVNLINTLFDFCVKIYNEVVLR